MVQESATICLSLEPPNINPHVRVHPQPVISIPNLLKGGVRFIFSKQVSLVDALYGEFLKKKGVEWVIHKLGVMFDLMHQVKIDCGIWVQAHSGLQLELEQPKILQAHSNVNGLVDVFKIWVVLKLGHKHRGKGMQGLVLREVRQLHKQPNLSHMFQGAIFHTNSQGQLQSICQCQGTSLVQVVNGLFGFLKIFSKSVILLSGGSLVTLAGLALLILGVLRFVDCVEMGITAVGILIILVLVHSPKDEIKWGCSNNNHSFYWNIMVIC